MWLLASRLATLAIDGAQSCGRRTSTGQWIGIMLACSALGQASIWLCMRTVGPRWSARTTKVWMALPLLPGWWLGYGLGLALGWIDIPSFIGLVCGTSLGMLLVTGWRAKRYRLAPVDPASPPSPLIPRA